MATIQINPLNPAGSDLFADHESYLQELTDAELNTHKGGIATLIIFISIMCIPCCVKNC